MNFKKIGATLLAMSMAAALAVAPATASQAAKVGGGDDEVVYTNSFANRDTTANPLTEDEEKVQASEDLARYNLPTTVTINPKKVVSIFDLKFYDDYYGYCSTTYFNIYDYNTYLSATDSNAKNYLTITDVTSSSSNLKIKVNGDYYKYTDYDGYTSIAIKAYAKKAGTYTIKYNLTYQDDNSVYQKEERSIKVIAKEYKPFTKVTFAGKSLWYDKNSASKYIYKTNDFTTKSKGKLVVKAAKGFKINKIEVGTYESKTVSANEYYNSNNTLTNEDTDTYSTTYSFSGSYKTAKTFADDYKLYDTYGNPIYCKWKTVKSGKNVKLSKVLSGDSKGNLTKTVTYTNKLSGQVTTTKTSEKYNYRKGASAPTIIRITYTDTRTGEVHQWEKTINKLIKK